jgi:hypothetical protein
MARKGSRKGGVASFVWNPFKHLLQFTGDASQKVGSSAGKVVKTTVGAVEGVGPSFAKHAKMALRGTRRSRKRKRRGTRRNERRH